VPWKKGFNFRQNPSFCTDGTDETYVCESPWDQYPVTPQRNGVDFGHESSFATMNSRDRVAPPGADRRLAGIWFPIGGGQLIIRVDLPAAGAYIIKLASGDAVWGNGVTDGIVSVQDGGVSTLFSIDHATGFSTGSTYRDATDAELSIAAWVAADGGAGRTVTFTTTICRLLMGDGGATRGGPVAHFSLEQVGGAPPAGIGGGAYDLSIRRTRWRR
jgi:hypothetical protein